MISTCLEADDMEKMPVTITIITIPMNMTLAMIMAKTMTMITIMIEQAGREADEMEKMLFDIEIGFLHRTIWVMLCVHFDPKVILS